MLLGQACVAMRSGAPKRTSGPSPQMLECLKMQQLVDPLHQLVEPFLFAKRPGRRGQRDQNTLGAALVAVAKVLRTCGLSHHKALASTHALLSRAGVWPDDDPHSLSGKFSQLQKRSPQACSPSKKKPII